MRLCWKGEREVVVEGGGGLCCFFVQFVEENYSY